MKSYFVLASMLAAALSVSALPRSQAYAQPPKSPNTLKIHTAVVSGVAFMPDGKTLVTASEDKTIKVWFAPAAREIATLGAVDLFDPSTWGR